MKNNSQTRQLFQAFYHMIEIQLNTKIKVLSLENGAEFAMTDFYASKGIVHQLSLVERPQQNSIVERKHQHLFG